MRLIKFFFWYLFGFILFLLLLLAFQVWALEGPPALRLFLKLVVLMCIIGHCLMTRRCVVGAKKETSNSVKEDWR